MSLQLTLSPMIMILISFFWAMFGLAIAWGIVNKKNRTIKLIWSWVILFSFAQLINDIFFTSDGGITSISTIKIGIFFSGIGLLAWTLSQESTKAHFGVHNEQQ